MAVETKPVPIKEYPPGKTLVHNATGSDMTLGQVVRLTGSETNGVPNAEPTDALDEIAFGVLYEDIPDGEDGICIDGDGWKVEVVVNADVTQGAYAGLSTAPGRVEDLDLVAGAKTRTIIGIFIGGAGTETAGDKVTMRIAHGVFARGS